MSRAALPWLLVPLLVAAAARLGRLPLAWNYWAIDYLSYPLVHADELSRGHVAWTQLTGLHPGQWSLLVAASEALGGGARAAWGFSLACSLGAIGVAMGMLRRAGAAPALLAGGLLAISPLHVHYGLELNNYPLYLLGAALLTAGAARALRGEGLGLALVGALVALHGHLAGHALVGAAAALGLWQLRRLTVAMVVAEVLAAPVTWAALGARRSAGTFHNERPGPVELVETLLTTWTERFAEPWALAALTLAVVGLATAALRDQEHREAAWALAAMAAAGITATLAGLLSGAAFVEQTPYWLQPSWALITLAGLGARRVSGGGGARLGLVLLIWVVPAGARALQPLDGLEPEIGVVEPPRWRAPQLDAPRHPVEGLTPGRAWAAPGFPTELSNAEPDVPGSWWRRAPIPGVEGPRVRSLPAPRPDALREYLEEGHRDVLVWIWEPAFLNDDPRGLDPLFAALDPADVGALRPVDEPWPGFCRDWRDEVACFLNRASLRGGGFEAELAAALEKWLADGQRVDLVFARLDPAQVPPDPRAMRARVAEGGGVWDDRFVGLTWVASIRPSSAP